MSNFTSWLAFIGGFILLIVVVVAVRVWVTMPPDIDPTTIPSQIAEDPSPDFAKAVENGRTIARELLAEEKLPGLSLAVEVDGTIVWAEGFRWADMENQSPVTPATLFRIGGVTQAITAAAVGVLVEAGHLDLDAPVQEYASGFPEKQWPISTRQLMAQTSGLRPHRGEGGLFQGRNCTEDSERLAIFAGDSLVFRPGTEYRYSTYGWMLVGAAISAAAGESYLDYVQQEVLTPLGMTSTVPDITGQRLKESAHFYYPRLMLKPSYGLQDSPDTDFSCYQAAVGFLSTPSDLVRLGSAMMSDALLTPGTIKELQTPIQLESGESTGEALGWTVQRIPMGADQTPTQVIGHGLGETVLHYPLGAATLGGQVAGGTASLLTVPEHRIAIAVATNVTGSENVSLIATRIADTFVRFLQGN